MYKGVRKTNTHKQTKQKQNETKQYNAVELKGQIKLK
jgi:hypothetical protein